MEWRPKIGSYVDFWCIKQNSMKELKKKNFYRFQISALDPEIFKFKKKMCKIILFHTYWDFRMESIAWKTYTGIFSSNHSRESTFLTWEKPFHPIRNQLSEWISQFASAFTLLLPLQSSSQKFVEFWQVYSSSLENLQKTTDKVRTGLSL